MPFSFVHLADTHLGYMQYNLPERREDFSRVFIEAVDKTIELKPSLTLISGDIFDSPRPSNVTLATAVRELRRLKDAGIKVLAVDGSHDMEPNVMTGTVLVPLHNAGLISYLPRMEQGCWEDDSCYVYGFQSFRSLREADEKLPSYLEAKPPKPKPDKFNIFMFHGAMDDPEYTPIYFKPDIRTTHMPEGFQYYAGGHVHQPLVRHFKHGMLVYPGCLETTAYTESEVEKGFYHVTVKRLDAPPLMRRIRVEKARVFRVEERNFSGKPLDRITEESSTLLRSLDADGAILILILRGMLPPGVKRSQVDVPKIRTTASRALHTIIINQMTELTMPEAVQPVKEARELKTVAYNYFSKVFEQKYPGELGERLARVAIELLDPLLSGEEGRVKSMLEEAVK